jgi:hypothetical protein
MAAYAIALALLFGGWHPRTRGMIDFHFVAIIFFMVVGAGGVYLALAVAMRWWPHNARLPDDEKLNAIEPLFREGKRLFEGWGRMTQESRVATNPAAIRDLTSRGVDFSNKLIIWQESSALSVDKVLGEQLGNRYRMAPDLSEPEPEWATSTGRVGLYQDALCRLTWLRTWSQDQFDL